MSSQYPWRRCFALLLLGLIPIVSLRARQPAEVIMSFPAKGRVLTKSDVVALVVDRNGVYFEQHFLTGDALVSVVDQELKTKPQGIVCVYVRPNTNFGDVVHCVDTLRQSNAATIAVSPTELPDGREP